MASVTNTGISRIRTTVILLAVVIASAPKVGFTAVRCKTQLHRQFGRRSAVVARGRHHALYKECARARCLKQRGAHVEGKLPSRLQLRGAWANPVRTAGHFCMP